jgi:hypothetical protein
MTIHSRRVAHAQQKLADLVGESLSVPVDQNPLRIFEIALRSRHAMLKQRPGASDPVAALDRFVA